MAARPISRNNFAVNLRWLCEGQPSIASVCRQTGINRQQFNRYLAGNAIPSAEVMRRICSLFGVPEAAMFLDRSELEALSSLGSNGENLARLLAKLGACTPRSLKPGLYFRYEPSPGKPDSFSRSLCWVREHGGSIFFRAPGGVRGLVMEIAGKEYFFEAAMRGRSGLSMAIFNGGDTLREGFVARAGAAVMAALEYLGDGETIRNLLSRCGTFPNAEMSAEVAAIIRRD